MAGSKTREVHARKSLTYRKGKQRLRPLSLPTLYEMAEKAKTGKKADAVRKEIARRAKMGFTYSPPAEITEET